MKTRARSPRRSTWRLPGCVFPTPPLLFRRVTQSFRLAALAATLAVPGAVLAAPPGGAAAHSPPSAAAGSEAPQAVTPASSHATVAAGPPQSLQPGGSAGIGAVALPHSSLASPAVSAAVDPWTAIGPAVELLLAPPDQPLFDDGFESGDLSKWSASVP